MSVILFEDCQSDSGCSFVLEGVKESRDHAQESCPIPTYLQRGSIVPDAFCARRVRNDLVYAFEHDELYVGPDLMKA